MLGMRGSRRFWVALVAAYALALQSLLGAVLVAKAATVSADHFAICLTSEDGAPADHGSPGTSHLPHQHCALCNVSQAGHALPGPDRRDVAIARVISAAVLFSTQERVVPLSAALGINARGPPATSIA